MRPGAYRIVNAAEDATRILPGKDPVDPRLPVAVPTQAAHLQQEVRGWAIPREGHGCPGAGRVVPAEYPARSS